MTQVPRGTLDPMRRSLGPLLCELHAHTRWTGGFFDASGKNFYVSVQHNISGSGTILRITGWGSQG
jgi:hypothetical protein